MMSQKRVITVTLRSHLEPTVYIDGFELGKKIQIKLEAHITVGEFIQKLFLAQQNHIGIIAVNGTIAKNTQILQHEDTIDIYGLMPGG